MGATTVMDVHMQRLVGRLSFVDSQKIGENVK